VRFRSGQDRQILRLTLPALGARAAEPWLVTGWAWNGVGARLKPGTDHNLAVSTEGVNVLGGPLEACGFDPLTGFWRDGTCRTGGQDVGVHAICAVMTEEFLAFSASVGNDLSTPRPELGFAGLAPGDRWCLCAGRWQEALDAGVAPPVVLEATHALALEFSSRDDLRAHAAL